VFAKQLKWGNWPQTSNKMGINIQMSFINKKQKYERFACTEASSAKFEIFKISAIIHKQEINK